MSKDSVSTKIVRPCLYQMNDRCVSILVLSRNSCAMLPSWNSNGLAAILIRFVCVLIGVLIISVMETRRTSSSQPPIDETIHLSSSLYNPVISTMGTAAVSFIDFGKSATGRGEAFLARLLRVCFLCVYVFCSVFAREREKQRQQQLQEKEAAKEAKRIEKLRARDELKNMRVEVSSFFVCTHCSFTFYGTYVMHVFRHMAIDMVAG